MSDNKKYYYLKLKENFYDSEAMIVLESMPDGYLYSNILMKLYLRSLQNGGKLMFNNMIPYTPTILAQVVRHQVGTVEKALKIFQELGLIEILENGAIYMMDIQNFIGESSTEADRIRAYRERISNEKKQKNLQSESVEIKGLQEGSTNVVQMYDKSTPEIDIDIDIDKEKDIDNIYVQNEVQKPDWEDKFEQFWKLYPKKQNKKKVQLWFKNKKPNDALFDTIIKKLKNFIDTVDWQKENGKYIPMPTTWLNGERWNDEIKSGSSNNIFYEIGKEEGLF